MKIVAFVLVSLVALIPPADAGSASQTFPVSLDRAWSTTEKVLDVLGWEIDKNDRTVGWLTTDSRKLDGEDYGVYAKGTRHRLRIHLKAEGGNRTTITVERSVFKRERILWIDTDEPLATQDQTVERGVLAAIGKSL
ncbi:MAG: hypothetical protein AUH20_03535 [Candidatus Rokubacteria bacterium 13_2_20CM_69_15_2]|nr:MAG: hypothetical protein AUH20_03535 [Candidatus Rokubacteria bacterium 13_2_20CM_69_15_2]PYO20398.1 MAG: hypothetical protein DMD88_12035 [Candidatus Rokubacteria bacterium]